MQIAEIPHRMQSKQNQKKRSNEKRRLWMCKQTGLPVANEWKCMKIFGCIVLLFAYYSKKRSFFACVFAFILVTQPQYSYVRHWNGISVVRSSWSAAGLKFCFCLCHKQCEQKKSLPKNPILFLNDEYRFGLLLNKKQRISRRMRTNDSRNPCHRAVALAECQIELNWLETENKNK